MPLHNEVHLWMGNDDSQERILWSVHEFYELSSRMFLSSETNYYRHSNHHFADYNLFTAMKLSTFSNHQESNRIADTWGIQTPPACPSMRPKNVRIRDTFRRQATYGSIGQPPGRFWVANAWWHLGWHFGREGNVESERVMVLQDLWLHIVYRDT